MDKNYIFCGIPTYDERLEHRTATAVQSLASKGKRKVLASYGAASLLCLNFNTLYASALNAREEYGVKWFVMLHADMIPEEGWLDTLIEEAESNNADMMGVVSPIKSLQGLTSTAIDDPGNPWEPFVRITQQQHLHPSFPRTFDAAMARKALAELPDEMKVDVPDGARLLANTGCMALRIDRPWSESINFQIQDRIVKKNGEWRAEVQPEDWLMSRTIHFNGGKVMATNKVRVEHRGPMDFSSRGLWGAPRDFTPADKMNNG